MTLLAEVARSPSIGIIGPKVRGWYDRRLLLEDPSRALRVPRNVQRQQNLLHLPLRHAAQIRQQHAMTRDDFTHGVGDKTCR